MFCRKTTTEKKAKEIMNITFLLKYTARDNTGFQQFLKLHSLNHSQIHCKARIYELNYHGIKVIKLLLS